eukprot:Hpha_TRINITY_DN15713_c2_g4::TRINITY_DN15713_c2_g4_i1::g.40975::m.40975
MSEPAAKRARAEESRSVSPNGEEREASPSAARGSPSPSRQSPAPTPQRLVDPPGPKGSSFERSKAPSASPPEVLPAPELEEITRLRNATSPSMSQSCPGAGSRSHAPSREPDAGPPPDAVEMKRAARSAAPSRAEEDEEETRQKRRQEVGCLVR